MYQTGNILITGGAGFIGSHVVNLLSQDQKIVVVDRMSYCSRKSNLVNMNNVKFYQTDICNKFNMLKILQENNIQTIIHFAAQTHVDMSFNNVTDFIRDNIKGTCYLLDACREYDGIKRFLMVSTDEVYGEIDFDVKNGCTEDSGLHPTNPYAATKASAEHMAMSYYKSYNIPIIITRGNNVYGPMQYPEKIIPKFCMQLLKGQPLTIHGSGTSKRTFIYTDDVARAFLCILYNGEIGQIYNIGSNDEYSVNEIAQILSNKFNVPLNKVEIKDRNFNDKRYLINSDKLKSLGWEPIVSFDKGIDHTIAFYREHFEEYKNLE